MPSARTQKFAAAFQSVRGVVHVVPTWDEAARRAAEICSEKQATCVALGELPAIFVDAFRKQVQSMPSIMSPPYASAGLPATIDAAQVGIGIAAYGIAQTGTLVEETADDAIRLVSALPRTYIGILDATEMVDTLRDAAPRLRAAFTNHATNYTVSFISGPSRTGDIEMILTLGVHGPEDAHAIIIDGDASGNPA